MKTEGRQRLPVAANVNIGHAFKGSEYISYLHDLAKVRLDLAMPFNG